MSDIVERIREVFSDTPEIIDMCDESYEGQEIASHIQGLYDAALEAANEIEQLRAKECDSNTLAEEIVHLYGDIDQLREKMKNIIEWCDKLLSHKLMPKPFADAIKEGRAALAGEKK